MDGDGSLSRALERSKLFKQEGIRVLSIHAFV